MVSDELEYAIGKTPRLAQSVGLYIIVHLLALLLAISYLYKYPDKLIGEFVLTSRNIPYMLYSSKEGRLHKLFFDDGDSIQAGEVIGVIENSTSFKEYIKLKKILFEKVSCEDSLEIGNLGVLNSYYVDYKRAIEENNNFFKFNLYSNKLKILDEKIVKYNELILEGKRQKLLQEDMLQIKKNKYSIDSSLFESMVIAKLEKDESLFNLISTEMRLSEKIYNVSNLEIELQEELERKIILRENYLEQGRQLEANLKKNYELLSGAVKRWEKEFLLISEIDGVLSFSKIWTENQSISKGDLVFTVLPLQNTEIIGKITIPIKKSRKLNNGSMVILKFSNYPYREFGVVQSNIESLSVIDNNTMIATIRISSSSIETNQGEFIPFKQNLNGTAEIIIHKERLLFRLLSPIKYLLGSVN